MKKNPNIKHYTHKTRLPQKYGFLVKWLGLFLGLVLLTIILGPTFLQNNAGAQHVIVVLNHYKRFFVVAHVSFVVSSIWWWPAYIQHRGRSNNWPDLMIKRASNWKWGVMLVLSMFCLLFFFT